MLDKEFLFDILEDLVFIVVVTEVEHTEVVMDTLFFQKKVEISGQVFTVGTVEDDEPQNNNQRKPNHVDFYFEEPIQVSEMSLEEVEEHDDPIGQEEQFY
jgi:chorismate synthase